MTVQFKKAFRFDLDRNVPVEIPISTAQDDFNDYLDQLIEDVIFDQRSKKYLFPDEPTTIMATIDGLMAKKISFALDAAKRLLRIEMNVQNRIDHLNREVQKGIMIQALVEHNGQALFLIIKAEHSDFINERDNKRATGLPIKKKIFKAFCAYLGEDNVPTHAMVSDYRNVISTYWWKDFLDLLEEYTNEYNTERAFEAIDRKIFNNMKEEHPRDYMVLRNATVQYFRSKDEFVMADYLDDIVRSYTPEDDSLDVEKLGNNIERLPEKAKFDSRFEIVKGLLKKRFIKRLPLTPQLELVIKEDIVLDSSVTAIKEDGVKYIKIRTDDGYDYFKKE